MKFYHISIEGQKWVVFVPENWYLQKKPATDNQAEGEWKGHMQGNQCVETQVQIQQFQMPPVCGRFGSLDCTWFQMPLGNSIVFVNGRTRE